LPREFGKTLHAVVSVVAENSATTVEVPHHAMASVGGGLAGDNRDDFRIGVPRLHLPNDASAFSDATPGKVSEAGGRRGALALNLSRNSREKLRFVVLGRCSKFDDLQA
jgi:hypothetical protein